MGETAEMVHRDGLDRWIGGFDLLREGGEQVEVHHGFEYLGQKVCLIRIMMMLHRREEGHICVTIDES